jgi:hypothetical protein
VSEVKEITVLAITKMHGGVCTAGIDSAGIWVRPIRKPSVTETHRTAITDYCLLPMDFFHGGRSHLVNLGVTSLHLIGPHREPPHIEDWALDTAMKPEFVRKLSETEQAQFLASHAKRNLITLDPLQACSLALVRPIEFSFRFLENAAKDDVVVRAALRVGEQEFKDVGCTDLRMRALGRSLLAGSKSEPVELTRGDFERRGKQATYLAVGLSRLYQGKHWPLVVGVHTIPEMDVEIDYARL